MHIQNASIPRTDTGTETDTDTDTDTVTRFDTHLNVAQFIFQVKVCKFHV